ncbi:MAG: Octanoyltransferase [Pseudomonadota bacterium]
MIVRTLGLVEYAPTYDLMRKFTDERQADTEDELWLCEHPPVFTQGLAGKAEHLLSPGDIPVVATNRGGQVTYHGPGQVVAYPLLDLKRRGFFVKELVYRLEESVIRALRHFGVTGHRVSGAPGIYVHLDDPFGHAVLPKHVTTSQTPGLDPLLPKLGSDPNFVGLGKIAALGIKVSRHCSYHGLALNVAMDLQPFLRINPCGYAGLPTVDLARLGVQASWAQAAAVLSDKLQGTLG